VEVGVKPGQRKLEVKKDGFKVFVRELEIAAGGRVPIRIRLEPPPPSPPGTPRPGEVLTVTLRPGVAMKFAWIPPGQFAMGGDKSAEEKPVHQVTLTRAFTWRSSPSPRPSGKP